MFIKTNIMTPLTITTAVLINSTITVDDIGSMQLISWNSIINSKKYGTDKKPYFNVDHTLLTTALTADFNYIINKIQSCMNVFVRLGKKHFANSKFSSILECNKDVVFQLFRTKFDTLIKNIPYIIDDAMILVAIQDLWKTVSLLQDLPSNKMKINQINLKTNRDDFLKKVELFPIKSSFPYIDSTNLLKKGVISYDGDNNKHIAHFSDTSNSYKYVYSLTEESIDVSRGLYFENKAFPYSIHNSSVDFNTVVKYGMSGYMLTVEDDYGSPITDETFEKNTFLQQKLLSILYQLYDKKIAHGDPSLRNFFGTNINYPNNIKVRLKHYNNATEHPDLKHLESIDATKPPTHTVLYDAIEFQLKNIKYPVYYRYKWLFTLRDLLSPQGKGPEKKNESYFIVGDEYNGSENYVEIVQEYALQKDSDNYELVNVPK